jgi:hypothetical protein
MHCFIVRLEEDLDAAVAEHREYLQRQQSYSVNKRGEIPLAEAARDLMRRGLRRCRTTTTPAVKEESPQMRLGFE